MEGIIKESVSEAIGGTPLINLRSLSKATGCRILGKAEWMNPGKKTKNYFILLFVNKC